MPPSCARRPSSLGEGLAKWQGTRRPLQLGSIATGLIKMVARGNSTASSCRTGSTNGPNLRRRNPLSRYLSLIVSSIRRGEGSWLGSARPSSALPMSGSWRVERRLGRARANTAMQPWAALWVCCLREQRQRGVPPAWCRRVRNRKRCSSGTSEEKVKEGELQRWRWQRHREEGAVLVGCGLEVDLIPRSCSLRW